MLVDAVDDDVVESAVDAVRRLEARTGNVQLLATQHPGVARKHLKLACGIMD